jgi:flagellin-specific chaperone FliS
MRRDVGDPTLVERTQALYTFMMTRLLDASHDKDVAPADEVIKLIEYDRETWALLMDQLASEQRPGSDQPQPNAQANSYTPFTAHG